MIYYKKQKKNVFFFYQCVMLNKNTTEEYDIFFRQLMFATMCVMMQTIAFLQSTILKHKQFSI